MRRGWLAVRLRSHTADLLAGGRFSVADLALGHRASIESTYTFWGSVPPASMPDGAAIGLIVAVTRAAVNPVEHRVWRPSGQATISAVPARLSVSQRFACSGSEILAPKCRRRAHQEVAGLLRVGDVTGLQQPRVEDGAHPAVAEAADKRPAACASRVRASA